MTKIFAFSLLMMWGVFIFTGQYETDKKTPVKEVKAKKIKKAKVEKKRHGSEPLVLK